jgi:protein-S-isoprenylcysteine O-methyltransferase Ste14
VLSLLTVQVLAGVTLATLLGGFLLGRAWQHTPRSATRVVAQRGPARWTEVVWVVGALVVVLWSVGVLLAPAYTYDWPGPRDFPYSGVVQLLGFLVAIAGGLLFFAAVRALGAQMTPAIQVQEGHRLVQEGPYRFIRHPAYTAIVTGAAGLSALYLSLPLALTTVVLAGIAVYRAHLEEELLGSPGAFGEVYTTYVSRTGRFLPRIRSRP